jgi:hypothetical protein
MEHMAAKTLDLNAIGVAEVTTDRPWCSSLMPTAARLAGLS